MKLTDAKTETVLSFHGGLLGAILPFVVFVGGVISIALSGAPDEKGFWPILWLAMVIGLILSKDNERYLMLLRQNGFQPSGH